VQSVKKYIIGNEPSDATHLCKEIAMTISGQRPCACGSGQPKHAVYDARGIFLTYVCDKCEKKKLAEFRPEVLTNPNYSHDEPIEVE